MKEEVTKERLSHLATLRREITRTKRRIAKLKNQEHPSLPAKRSLKKLEKDLEDYITAANNEASFLIKYIQSIKDVTVREIFMLRYYDGVRSWQKIAFSVGEHDESYVRRKHNAHFKTKSKKNTDNA